MRPVHGQWRPLVAAVSMALFACDGDNGGGTGPGTGAAGAAAMDNTSAGTAVGSAGDTTAGESPASTPTITEGQCVLSASGEAEYTQTLGCQADFDALSSEPADTSLPGARSVKVVVDMADNNALYFQHSTKFPIHYDFVSKYLSGNGLPVVPMLSAFNQAEYFTAERRFLLAAVTYYAGPDAWTLELSPYDSASPEMIELLYTLVRDGAFFGSVLKFHPTSDVIEQRVEGLSSAVPIITTDELFAGIDYQPLNLGTAIGQFKVLSATQLEDEYVSGRDIVLLDRVPNDISVVAGLITEEFQTPLSHVNVLSQNRGTPNMGLRGATQNADLLALAGKWVRLTVGPFEYKVEEVTSEEADAFFEENGPAAVQVPNLNLDETELRDIADLVHEEVDGATVPLRDAIKAAIPAYGGKAAHFSVLAQIEEVPSPPAFAIPVYYYQQFMDQNGFAEQVDAMLEDETFLNDPAVRTAQLEELRTAMETAPIDPDFEETLRAKLEVFPEQRIRFRSSTNAEDLDGFTGAGLYTSKTGDRQDWEDVVNAVREVWSSVWYFRAYEERAYRKIDHRQVGMALLVHHSFPDEDANGVALTANPFDAAGLEPGFYVNVQLGEASVVQPEAGVTTDQFIYHYATEGKPITYLSHSSLVPAGSSVLTLTQVDELGAALAAVHRKFDAAYGARSGNTGYYAMDVEFKLDSPGEDPPSIVLKQARPHPGRGQ